MKTTTLPLPPPPQQQSTTNPVIASFVSTLEKVCTCANFDKRHKLQEKTIQGLSSRVFTLKLWDLPHKIDQTVNKVVKEDVQTDLQAPLCERFRDLSEADMKEIIHQQMFESGSYKSHSDHKALYEALEPSDDIPIPNDIYLTNSEDIGANHLPKNMTRPDWLKPIPEEKEALETPEPDWIGKSKLSKADLEGPSFKQTLPLGGPPGQVTIQTQYFFIKDLENLVSGDNERRNALSISKLKASYYQDFGLKELVPSLWIESERDYDISAAYDISHWWFKRKKFYITRDSTSSDRHVVRSHMKILSVVSLKTFSRYGYTYLKEIVLCRADYQDYKILEADFKNIHPSDFEDLRLLHLHSKLNTYLDQTKLPYLMQSIYGLETSSSDTMWKTYNLMLRVIRRSSILLNRTGMHMIFSSKKITLLFPSQGP
nr:hypothetical protein [Tanacetum cinerariifolium]